MGLFDAFRYDGKRVLVVGGASGMGAAAAELVQNAGAEVIVMDFADVTLAGAKAIHVNLGDKDSIDQAFERARRTRCMRSCRVPVWLTARPTLKRSTMSVTGT